MKIIDLRIGISWNKSDLCVVLVLGDEELVDGRFEIKAILTVLDTWDFLISDDSFCRSISTEQFFYDFLIVEQDTCLLANDMTAV